MPRNVEIKARLDGERALAELAARAAALGADGPRHIEQDDTFFAGANGRLKLRAFADGSGELIHYRRADSEGPKESFYVLAPVAGCDPLREALTLAYGQAGRVRKRRELWLAGRTRVHLDRVEGLGAFLELEVMLRDDEAIAAGEAEARALMGALGVAPAQLVEGAYVDLLMPGAT
jgi:predicted adenylyl cyclase CyaB